MLTEWLAHELRGVGGGGYGWEFGSHRHVDGVYSRGRGKFACELSMTRSTAATPSPTGAQTGTRARRVRRTHEEAKQADGEARRKLGCEFSSQRPSAKHCTKEVTVNTEDAAERSPRLSPEN